MALSIDDWLHLRSVSLFSRVGRPLEDGDYMVAQCGRRAARFILSGHTDAAIHEQGNLLRGAVQDFNRLLYDLWSELVAKLRPAVVELTLAASARIELQFEPKVITMLLQHTRRLILFALMEEVWGLPPELRFVAPVERILLSGHCICGWANGLYPDGCWVVW